MNLDDECSKEIVNKAFEAIEITKKTGKLKKGVNEVTKALERDQAKLVVVAKNVNPKEILMHLPSLCSEKGVPLIVVSNKEDLGAAAGLPIGTSAVAITQEGDSKGLLKEIIEWLKE